MRTYMIIPTYWTGENGEWKEGDSIYDHATQLNGEGTLLRTLKSISILEDKHFTLIILGIVTNKKYLDAIEAKLKWIIKNADLGVDTILFTDNNLTELKTALYENLEPQIDMLSLSGYSNVRNICLFLPYILDAETAILIDDDEVFEDPLFVTKAKEFIGKKFYGNTIDGIAGYYLNEDNEYYDKVNIVPWMTYWDRFGGKREAFDNIIGKEPRLKKTPFAFGGAMVIHRNLMRIVPFDPMITRGEDTDYVINSRIFGFNFYLDNKLAIKHLPPPKSHPIWKRFREDIYRFLYDKSKFDNQTDEINLHQIAPEDFDPYPGQFMKDDLGDKIFKTNIILALDYLANNEIEACRETIKNIYLARYEAIPHENTFQNYLNLQKNWRKILENTKGFGNILKDIIKKGTIIKHDKYLEVKEHILKSSGINDDLQIESFSLFTEFTKKEQAKMLSISKIVHIQKDDYVFRTGDENKCIYVILKGTLVIKKNNSLTGDEITVSYLAQGDHFNETSIFFDEPHYVDIQATSKVELMVIDNDSLKELISKNDRLSTKILWIISRKLSERLIKTTQKFSDTREMNSDVSDFLGGQTDENITD